MQNWEEKISTIEQKIYKLVEINRAQPARSLAEIYGDEAIQSVQLLWVLIRNCPNSQHRILGRGGGALVIATRCKNSSRGCEGQYLTARNNWSHGRQLYE